MINLGAIQLTYIAGGFNGNGTWQSTTTTGATLFAGPDDDSCVYVSSQNKTTGKNQLDIWVVDIGGRFTHYQAAGETGGNWYVATLNKLSRSILQIILSNGNNYVVPVQNAKINNASPIFIKPTALGVSNSCYNIVQNVFYDDVKKLLIAGFYKSAGQDNTDIFSSAYQVSDTGALIPESSGFVGNFGPGQDGFDRTYESSAITDLQASNIASNGLNLSIGGSTLFEGWGIQQSSYDVTPGVSTACNPPAGVVTGSYVSMRSYGYWAPGTPYGPGVANSCMGDSSIPGVACFCYQTSNNPNYGYYFYGNNAFFVLGLSDVMIPPAGEYASYIYGSFALTKKYIFAICSVGYPYGYDYIAATANPGIANGSSVHRRGYFTINNTRAVSPDGRFRT